jgi:short-subunit dehydrogenase
LPGMLEAGHGDLVVTASLAGLVPISPDPIYGLTKHAVVGFVRSMAAALDLHATPTGVCISAVCPGFTDTAILNEASKLLITRLGLEIMAPEHVADAVMQAVRERVNGAQWVVWPGAPVAPYEWAPPVPMDEVVPGARR